MISVYCLEFISRLEGTLHFTWKTKNGFPFLFPEALANFTFLVSGQI